jgi:aspartyl-tRNA(Asn)/glutamyl-tRNA(Gln) amidotransferase subunit C
MDIGDLKETANLARLNLGETELKAAFPAFEQMLTFFEAMQAADNDTAAFGGPLAAVTSARRSVSQETFRSDENPAEPETYTETLLENPGDRDGRFIVIPNVL